MTDKPWLQPSGEIKPIRYPLINVYAAKNIHGYAAYCPQQPDRVDYHPDPWSKWVPRCSKEWYSGIEEGLLALPCHICGESQENADHQFTLVRLTNEKGLLLNEDGTLLKITHNRPNLQCWLTGIKEAKE
jgi:hypothetical protein